MKKLLFVSSLLVMFMVAPMAMADQVTTVAGYGPYQTGSGGEFTLRPDADMLWILDAGYVDGMTKNVQNLLVTFQTFCVETGETINQNTTYNASISQTSISTGNPLTLGAAWLYHQFQIGELENYDYARIPSPTNETAQLQAAIWYFMGVGADPNNQFSILGTSNGGFGLNSGQIPVAVLNLHTLAGGPAQDMLVCVPGVPEPATMLLLGSGLLGLAGFARKRFKK